MDLRRRLVGYLGALLGGLLVVAVAIHLHSLRGDLDAEVAASTHLVDILVAASQPGTTPEQVQALLRDAPLRHISIEATAQAPAERSWLAALLAPEAARDRKSVV